MPHPCVTHFTLWARRPHERATTHDVNTCIDNIHFTTHSASAVQIAHDEFVRRAAACSLVNDSCFSTSGVPEQRTPTPKRSSASYSRPLPFSQHPPHPRMVLPFRKTNLTHCRFGGVAFLGHGNNEHTALLRGAFTAAQLRQAAKPR